MKRTKTVDEYIEKHADRKLEIQKLRSILQELPFEECIKWGMPTYTVKGKNVLGIGSFKHWSCLWFHQGSFLKDEAGVLENAQEGKTKGMRQWRFANKEAIDPDLVKAYAIEAYENQMAGKEVDIAKPASELIPLPQLLASHLNKNGKHLNTFESFTVSQKNEFSNYIKEAKREKTKLDRLEKIKNLLEEGKTLKSLWS
ncbi:YdeI/OmpD-associated family protein [Portibacter marinus]|uniref:YdeI/OmpD-associated family protein n=1 Tax=Portibacter marinus TaxID=2898660 RepID=UPI001F1D540C|nr:DUF1801 domain-containing protein [Portibacter marinus]